MEHNYYSLGVHRRHVAACLSDGTTTTSGITLPSAALKSQDRERASDGRKLFLLGAHVVHDITALGATVQFNQAVTDSTCQYRAIDHDITVRNNLIQSGIGEGLYMTGNYSSSAWGGCQTGPNAGTIITTFSSRPT